jgi:hypothetical protein
VTVELVPEGTLTPPELEDDQTEDSDTIEVSATTEEE